MRENPLPIDAMMGALQDRIHRDDGPVRAAKSVIVQSPSPNQVTKEEQVSDSIYPTQDEAIAAAIAASVADGLGGTVIVHERACAMSGDAIDVDCTCAPITLQLGAEA